MARLIGVCCNNEFHSRTTNLSARHANPHWPASAERIIAQDYPVVILRRSADAER
jgi:hypothetical protein